MNYPSLSYRCISSICFLLLLSLFAIRARRYVYLFLGFVYILINYPRAIGTSSILHWRRFCFSCRLAFVHAGPCLFACLLLLASPGSLAWCCLACVRSPFYKVWRLSLYQEWNSEPMDLAINVLRDGIFMYPESGPLYQDRIKDRYLGKLLSRIYYS